MWQAKYKNINRSGLTGNVRVTIEYSDGVTNVESDYDILPEDIKSDIFASVIQNQLDVLENRDVKLAKVNVAIDDNAAVSVKGLGISNIIP